MSRYIDADEVIAQIEYSTQNTWGKGLGNAWWAHSVKLKDNIVNLMKNTPTADVVEVRHGEWIGTEYDGYADGNPVYDKWECSECHEEYNSDGEPPMFNFCPNCGAKMDGERSKEQ